MKMNHEILLSNIASKEDKHQSAQNILNEYDLQVLNIDQILNAFEKMTKECMLYIYYRFDITAEYLLIMNQLLKENIKMYIAVILAFNNDDDFYCYQMRKINVKTPSPCPKRVQICCRLLHYCDFDVSNLNISCSDKLQIKVYRDELYSGKVTKCAKVNNM